MKTPLVSIILPVYNGASRIQEAINSVISQSCADRELLVIDDGSNDNTGEIVDRFVKNDSRIKYIKNETNSGIQKTLNKGLKEAQGEYIARIDDDDMWIDKDKLKKQIEFLEKNTEYVLVGTGAVLTDENKEELSRFIMPEKDADIRNKILSKNCFIHSSVMFKKSAALKFGGYDESTSTRHIEDYDLWLKLGTIGKFSNLSIYAVSLKQGKHTISAKNRINQALRIVDEIKRFKNSYPKFFKGYLFSVIRLMFFLIQKIIPFSDKTMYHIKTAYKQY